MTHFICGHPSDFGDTPTKPTGICRLFLEVERAGLGSCAYRQLGDIRDIEPAELRLGGVYGLDHPEVIRAGCVSRRPLMIILTSSGAKRYLAGSYSRHTNSHLIKPVKFETLSRFTLTTG